VPIDGGTVATISTDWVSLQDLALGKGAAYLTDVSECKGNFKKGRILKISLDGRTEETLADCVNEPDRILLNDSHIIWSTGGPYSQMQGMSGIHRIPLAGGASEPVLIGAGTATPPLAGDGDTIYFPDAFTVKKVSMAGGSPEILVVSDSMISSLTTDGINVYWIEDGLANVFKVQVDGVTRVPLASGTGPAGPIVVHGDHVYWIERQGKIKKVGINGGEPTLIVSGLPFLSSLAVDDTHVYFSEQDSGAIRKVPVDGGAPTFLGMGLFLSWNILALDEDYVYWVNQAYVSRVLKEGGTVFDYDGVLNSLVTVPNAIAVDSGAVYWTETGGGIIQSVRPK
jgi:hypothetical protein